MSLIYKKEISESGIERFAALRENSKEEINVAIHPDLVCRISLQYRPSVDERPECTSEEFFNAYQKGLDGFGLFLLSLREIPTPDKSINGKIQVDFDPYGMP